MLAPGPGPGRRRWDDRAIHCEHGLAVPCDDARSPSRRLRRRATTPESDGPPGAAHRRDAPAVIRAWADTLRRGDVRARQALRASKRRSRTGHPRSSRAPALTRAPSTPRSRAAPGCCARPRRPLHDGGLPPHRAAGPRALRHRHRPDRPHDVRRAGRQDRRMAPRSDHRPRSARSGAESRQRLASLRLRMRA